MAPRNARRHTAPVNASPRVATVYVVDDNPSIQRALVRLLHSAGMEGTAFASIHALLSADIARDDACVIADVRLDHDDGLRIPQLLADRGNRLPVIFLTALDTGDMRARAHRAGAAAFFRKPVDDQALIDTVRWVLQEQDADAQRTRDTVPK